MKHSLVFIILSILSVGFPQAGTADTTSYRYGDPTDAEQAHLEAINRARSNPAAEAARLGIDLNEGLPASTIDTAPVQPLTMNARLLSAARSHASDMIANDYFDHNTQSNGDTPFERMVSQGFHYTSAGENISYSGSTGPLNEVTTLLGMHDSLFVDAGVPSRGHRLNILKAGFKEVGTGSHFGEYTSYAHTFMLTSDFGTSSDYSESFLLGVVYEDTDQDGIYDAGEGVGNVSITVDSPYAETRTASAGGYGIPLADGAYTVTATLPDGAFVQKSVAITGRNRKIDFLISEFSLGATPPSGPGTGGGETGAGGCFIHTSSNYSAHE